MAHFAEIDDTGIVIRVLVVPDDQEGRGHDYLSIDCGLGGTWVQTSYTSRGGKKVDPDSGQVVSENHMRYKFASPGDTFIPSFGVDGAFVAPRPGPWHVLDPNTALWTIPEGINPLTGEQWSDEELVVQELLSRLPIETTGEDV